MFGLRKFVPLLTFVIFVAVYAWQVDGAALITTVGTVADHNAGRGIIKEFEDEKEKLADEEFIALENKENDDEAPPAEGGGSAAPGGKTTKAFANGIFPNVAIMGFLLAAIELSVYILKFD